MADQAAYSGLYVIGVFKPTLLAEAWIFSSSVMSAVGLYRLTSSCDEPMTPHGEGKWKKNPQRVLSTIEQSPSFP